ncbi:zinc ribbon domain-containing protein, partial [Dehalococcoidia bacterium]|nr:zinc ribbon domain-containing protein [Dehalococcoidia bacterium]
RKLFCGKEWCKQCGEDDSASHKRRQARLLPKIRQIKNLGYFVIEWPEWARWIGQGGLDPDLDGKEKVAGWCYSKTDLRETTNIIIDVLAGKRCGRRGRVGGYFGRGITRWHWFGEKRPGKLNPHLNVLADFDTLSDEVKATVQPAIEQRKAELRSSKQTKKVRKELRAIECYERGISGYLPKPLLEKIQNDLRMALNIPDLIVHYSYFDKPGQMVNKVHYVTRATFRDYAWDPYLAEELYNFRNIRWWGSWNDDPVWSLKQAEVEGADIEGLEAVSSLQEGFCPDCGEPLEVLYYNRKTGKAVQWSRPIDAIYLDIWQAEEIAETGYYRIPHSEWTGYNFSPAELLRLESLERSARSKGFVSNRVAVTRRHSQRWRERKSWWESLQKGVV